MLLSIRDEVNPQTLLQKGAPFYNACLHSLPLMSLLTGCEESPRLSEKAPRQSRLTQMVRLVERYAGQKCSDGLIRVSGGAEGR